MIARMSTESPAGRPLVGPPARPLVGNLPDLAPPLTRFDRIQRWRREYGDVFRVSMGPAHPTMVLVMDPVVVKRVLLDNAKNYPKSKQYDKLKPLLGEGLLTSGGDFWLRQRRMMQPHFHQKYVATLLPPMVSATADLIAKWRARPEPTKPVDVAAELMGLTLRIVGLTLLGTEVSHDAGSVGHALGVSLEAGAKEFFRLIDRPQWLPTPENRKVQAARAELDRVVYALIRARRTVSPRPETGPRDLLDMLVEARDEETDEGMTDQQLRDEVMTIFLAGHETTATALGWTFYLLSKHPDARRRVQAEVAEVLGDRDPTWDDLPKLAYTGRVIDEAMRLYPPIYVIQRMAVEADVLGGYAIPAGQDVTLSIYALHHHPAHWENPEGFDPDRFLPERSQDRERYAFMPFGGGGRVCIGNGFATVEAKIVLAMIARAFDLDLVPAHPVVPVPMITLRQKHGMLMDLHRRKGTNDS